MKRVEAGRGSFGSASRRMGFPKCSDLRQIAGSVGTTPIQRMHVQFEGESALAVVAGGGLRMGQVVGETDARAEQVKGKAYTPQNVLATIYHLLGIDPARTFPDYQGRPVNLLDDREKIRELM